MKYSTKKMTFIQCITCQAWCLEAYLSDERECYLCEEEDDDPPSMTIWDNSRYLSSYSPSLSLTECRARYKTYDPLEDTWVDHAACLYCDKFFNSNLDGCPGGCKTRQIMLVFCAKKRFPLPVELIRTVMDFLL
jgi:hypothetical protein